MAASDASCGLAERIERLESRLAIQELLADFGRAIDEWNDAELRVVLAEDVAIRRGPRSPALSGVDMVVAAMLEMQKNVRAIQHYISNIRVDLEAGGNRAIVSAAVLAVRDTDPSQGGALLPRGGTYRMEVVRCSSPRGWCIGSVDLTEIWADPRLSTNTNERRA